MHSIKYIIATLLLIYSAQSLALFMPGKVQVSVDTAVVSDEVGC